MEIEHYLRKGTNFKCHPINLKENSIRERQIKTKGKTKLKEYKFRERVKKKENVIKN